MTSYGFHPLANIFPLMEGDDYSGLVEDIKANGLHEAIVLYEGRILDGRNWYRACLDAGVPPRAGMYDGEDPVGYVVRLNLKRRHLNESQRAMVAARLATLEDGQRQRGKFASLATQSEAAEMLNVYARNSRSSFFFFSRTRTSAFHANRRYDSIPSPHCGPTTRRVGSCSWFKKVSHPFLP